MAIGQILFHLHQILWCDILADFDRKLVHVWKYCTSSKRYTTYNVTRCTNLLSRIFKIFKILKIQNWNQNGWHLTLKKTFFFNYSKWFKMIQKFEKSTNWIYAREPGIHYKLATFQTHTSISGVFEAPRSGKGMVSFRLGNFCDFKEMQIRTSGILESWRSSESRKCALNAKIFISKSDLIWPDLDMISFNSQGGWRHNLKWTSRSIQGNQENMRCP